MFTIRAVSTLKRKWFAEIIQDPGTDSEISVYRTADYGSKLMAITIADAVREKLLPSYNPWPLFN